MRLQDEASAEDWLVELINNQRFQAHHLNITDIPSLDIPNIPMIYVEPPCLYLLTFNDYLQLMRTPTGLTSRDQNFIHSTCRSIARFDQYGVSELALRQHIYMLGLFTFRQFYKAGFPSDYKNPSLKNLTNVSG